MEQLIEITTVPIKYQLKVQNASLNYKSSLAEVEITRDQGEMKIRSKPIKLRMDTFDARNSIAPIHQNLHYTSCTERNPCGV